MNLSCNKKTWIVSFSWFNDKMESPALKWGLLNEILLLKANSISLAWMDTTKAVELIKWPSGSKVNLEILRVWRGNRYFNKRNNKKKK